MWFICVFTCRFLSTGARAEYPLFTNGVKSLAFFPSCIGYLFLFSPDFAAGIVFEICPGCNTLSRADFSGGPVLVHSHNSAGIREKKPA